MQIRCSSERLTTNTFEQTELINYGWPGREPEGQCRHTPSSLKSRVHLLSVMGDMHHWWTLKKRNLSRVLPEYRFDLMFVLEKQSPKDSQPSTENTNSKSCTQAVMNYTCKYPGAIHPMTKILNPPIFFGDFTSVIPINRFRVLLQFYNILPGRLLIKLNLWPNWGKPALVSQTRLK